MVSFGSHFGTAPHNLAPVGYCSRFVAGFGENNPIGFGFGALVAQLTFVALAGCSMNFGGPWFTFKKKRFGCLALP